MNGVHDGTPPHKSTNHTNTPYALPVPPALCSNTVELPWQTTPLLRAKDSSLPAIPCFRVWPALLNVINPPTTHRPLPAPRGTRTQPIKTALRQHHHPSPPPPPPLFSEAQLLELRTLNLQLAKDLTAAVAPQHAMRAIKTLKATIQKRSKQIAQLTNRHGPELYHSCYRL